MSANEDLLVQWGRGLVGIFGATGKYDVSRPIYNVLASPESSVITGASMRIVQGSSTLGKVRIPGADHYTIMYSKALQEGDVITKCPSNGLPITVISSDAPTAGVIGIRTDQIGKIEDGTTDIYTNVRFAYAKSSGYNQPVNIPYEATKAIIFGRANLTKMMWFEDSAHGKRFQIQQVDFVHNCMILTLDEGGGAHTGEFI